MFTPSNMLLKYVNAEKRDIYDIVGALMGYINADPQFRTNDFDDAVNYVITQGVSENELFAPFDAELEFEEDSTKWDDDYYSYARVYLKDNFCRKRISHVKDIARKLYPMIGGQQSEGKKTKDQQPIQRNISITRKPAILGGICIVVIVMLVILIASIIK